MHLNYKKEIRERGTYGFHARAEAGMPGSLSLSIFALVTAAASAAAAFGVGAANAGVAGFLGFVHIQCRTTDGAEHKHDYINIGH